MAKTIAKGINATVRRPARAGIDATQFAVERGVQDSPPPSPTSFLLARVFTSCIARAGLDAEVGPSIGAACIATSTSKVCTVCSRCSNGQVPTSAGASATPRLQHRECSHDRAAERTWCDAGTRATTFFSKGLWSTLVVHPRRAIDRASCLKTGLLADTSDEEDGTAVSAPFPLPPAPSAGELQGCADANICCTERYATHTDTARFLKTVFTSYPCGKVKIEKPLISALGNSES